MRVATRRTGLAATVTFGDMNRPREGVDATRRS